MESLPTMADLGVLANYSALPSAEGQGIMTTLDLTQRSNVVLLQNALAGESLSLWDMGPEDGIVISDVIAHYAEREDEETGEVTRGPMLTLIGPECNYHTGSKFAFRGLQSIAILCGRPPWRPPIKVFAVRCKSRNKREYQSIVLAE